MFRWNAEVKLSDLLTVGSILVAAAALLITWRKDRRLRKREYADKVRQASSRALGTLERWKELGRGFFDDLQPLITDADNRMVASQEPIETRDLFWRGVVEAHAQTSRAISQAALESEYVDLHAYEPSFFQVFRAATEKLRSAQEET